MKEIIEYHDNGNISRKYHEDDNGNIHGLYQVWYDNGQLDIKCNYNNYNLHGLYQVWYDNGQLLVEVIYINGEETDIPIPTTREEKILFKIKHGIDI